MSWGMDETYKDFQEEMSDFFVSASEEFLNRSSILHGEDPVSSSRIFWTDRNGDVFERPFINSWTSSSKTKTIPLPNISREDELIEKISKYARKDWRLALLDILFVNELCALFGHDRKVLYEDDSGVLIEACSLVGAPACEFPLKEMELDDAVCLRSVTMRDGIERSLIGEEELDHVKEHAEKLDRYSAQISDLCRIWAYASRMFCGSEHLVPVSKLEDLIESRGEKSFGNMDDLAKATGADVLLDAYFSGVPADDIIA